ncbi:MAG: M14 family zinc carboxypeptidase [Planctomycetota bacterium]
MNQLATRSRDARLPGLCRFAIAWALAVVFVGAGQVTAEGLTSNAELERRLTAATEADGISRAVIGKSVEGRPIDAIRVQANEDAVDAVRVLLIGQQHGDEPAGTEALLDLMDDLATDKDTLPAGVELWIVPRANPDGAGIGKRRNANDADLNRDHALLSQPETRALHAFVRGVRPHLVVDCHEFTRDSADYAAHGYTEWPLIMLDTANLTIYPEPAYQLGVRLNEAAAERLRDADIQACRYYVGSFPGPAGDGALRFSTLDADDARNGFGAYGAMSFIIESGIHRKAEDPDADLPARVAAYRQLFDTLLAERVLRACREMSERMRSAELPEAVATNAMWANTSLRFTPLRVVDAETGQARVLQTTAFAHDRVVKSAVATPAGYVIHADAAEPYTRVLDAHGLDYTTLDQPQQLHAERVELVRMEDTYDAVYHRYAGRQITRPLPAKATTFPAGSLVVRLDQLDTVDGRRAILLLEPRMLFGLYQWPEFQRLAQPGAPLPIARLLPSPEPGDASSAARTPSP